MPNHFVSKMAAVGHNFTPDDPSLDALVARVRTVRRGKHIFRAGSSPGYIAVLLDGWAIRSKVIARGSQQTLSVLLPGDFLNIDVAEPSKIDHDVLAVNDVQVAEVNGSWLTELLSESPEARVAMWRLGLIEQAVQRCWIASLGKRPALERLAHLFCEFNVRLGWVGIGSEAGYPMPFTQQGLGDATGLTAVHINRTLMRLRSNNLIDLHTGTLKITDGLALASLADFDPSYLLEPLSMRRPY